MQESRTWWLLGIPLPVAVLIFLWCLRPVEEEADRQSAPEEIESAAVEGIPTTPGRGVSVEEGSSAPATRRRLPGTDERSFRGVDDSHRSLAGTFVSDEGTIANTSGRWRCTLRSEHRVFGSARGSLGIDDRGAFSIALPVADPVESGLMHLGFSFDSRQYESCSIILPSDAEEVGLVRVKRRPLLAHGTVGPSSAVDEHTRIELQYFDGRWRSLPSLSDGISSRGEFLLFGDSYEQTTVRVKAYSLSGLVGYSGALAVGSSNISVSLEESAEVSGRVHVGPGFNTHDLRLRAVYGEEKIIVHLSETGEYELKPLIPGSVLKLSVITAVQTGLVTTLETLLVPGKNRVPSIDTRSLVSLFKLRVHHEGVHLDPVRIRVEGRDYGSTFDVRGGAAPVRPVLIDGWIRIVGTETSLEAHLSSPGLRDQVAHLRPGEQVVNMEKGIPVQLTVHSRDPLLTSSSSRCNVSLTSGLPSVCGMYPRYLKLRVGESTIVHAAQEGVFRVVCTLGEARSPLRVSIGNTGKTTFAVDADDLGPVVINVDGE